MVTITDQPLRVAAFLIFGPLLARKGFLLGDTFVTMFGLVLMTVEGFCILFKRPQMLEIRAE
jgi:hypothetical protein